MPASIRIYTTTYCGYCRRAKDLLARKGVSFEEIDVTRDDARRTWLIETTGRRTVPQIFIGSEAIGGFEELLALEARGELDARVAAA